MKSREATKSGPPSADLLVCFPGRAHLALMPKPICSPARAAEPNKRRSYRHNNHHHLNLKRIATSQASWPKNKQLDSEPTSPKVTCAGQIKVRPGNWHSVMEEMERIHKKKKKKKKPSWVDSLGFKKDILHFLTCLRTIRLDFRCFRAFPQSDSLVTDDDDDDDQAVGGGEKDEPSPPVFSKWSMLLQQNQNDAAAYRKEQSRENCEAAVPAVPPPNALLLMRCRSAPAKSWMEEEEKCRERVSRNLRSLLEEEKENVKENMVVMKYDAGLCKISRDICRETWVVGGGTTRDPLSRSTSWKR